MLTETGDVLRYDDLVGNALRNVVYEALRLTSEQGLPGGHYFYLTFETGADGVEMPRFLAGQYPDQMTIVIQHQFDKLRVDPDCFSVVLRFGGRPCHLRVPFAALTAFVDPSVKFALHFGGDQLADAAKPAAGAAAEPGTGHSEAAADSHGSAEVVTLDSFRRKP